MNENLTLADTHFKFGENWKSFVKKISEDQIAESVKGLQKLFPDGELQGKHFLDIGCGSGLSMLAALRLGASRAVGIDIDEASVEAAKLLLSTRAPNDKWMVSKKSVFELESDHNTKYDVVHSWGVLHHTGDMWRAVEAAGAIVPEQGLFALALYKKTPLCKLWRIEKRVYGGLPGAGQWAVQAIYKTAFLLGKTAQGKNPARYIRDYKSTRGMDWGHDVHDWLGGYPYESASAEEVERALSSSGFTMLRRFLSPSGPRVFGSACDEFVARRIRQAT